MVGVPGRSKGCATCRRRKIACSLERPSCFQCTRTGRECLGYQRDRVFVSSSASRGPSNTTWRPGEYRTHGHGKPSSDGAKSQAALAQDCQLILRHQGLENSAHRQQMMGNFLTRFVIHKKLAGRWDTPMLGMIPAVPSPPELLDFATYALCTLRLGRTEDQVDGTLVHSSRQLYGRAMQAMHRALSDPVLALKDETLAACLVLATYEIYECTVDSRSGYDSHYKGCARLVQLRGVKAHKTGLGHACFCAFRAMGAFESLADRETFLREPQWKNETFSEMPKSPYHRLIDIIFDSHVLMRQAGLIVRSTSALQRLEGLMILANDCWKFDEQFQKFYSEIKSETNEPLYWPGRTTDCDLFPVEFHFIDTSTATTLVLYWACLTALWSGMARIYQVVDIISQKIKSQMLDCPDLNTTAMQIPDTSTLPGLGHRTNFIESARCVCQSIEFCLQDDSRLVLLLSPLNMINIVVADWVIYKAEVEWIQGALEKVRRRGLSMVRYLPLATDIGPQDMNLN